ncbi:hypothetical protein C5B93_01095 [Rathayibacter sp. AY1A2]|nr:hypothetical protein C5B93_01095 [Rathayibacter sp. AY1A2]
MRYAKPYDPTPSNIERTADETEKMRERVGEMVDAMHTQLELTQATLATAQQAEDRSHRMSIASTWIAVVSLAIAAASLVVAIATLATTA